MRHLHHMFTGRGGSIRRRNANERPVEPKLIAHFTVASFSDLLDDVNFVVGLVDHTGRS